MSLRRSLESLPRDRETEFCVRELLLTLRRHQGEWLTAGEVAEMAGVSDRCAGSVLETFAAASVIAREGSPPRFRFAPDRLLVLEVESFLRRANSHTGMLQDSVARFRERYGR